MTNEERKKFWDTLCSLDGKDFTADHIKMANVISSPQYITRYRHIDEKTLGCLETNTLYFSSANYYDDPFDTFIHIDINKVKKEIESSLHDEKEFQVAWNSFVKAFHKTSTKRISARNLNGMNLTRANKLLEYANKKGFKAKKIYLDAIRNVRASIKNNTWSLCFSESELNEVLWIKYADMHKGFALTYDMNNSDNKLCGKNEICKDCPMIDGKAILYPIYYSETYYEPQNLPKFLVFQEMFKNAVPDKVLEEICKPFSNVFWDYIRVNFIKKLCHEHDKEWRILVHCQAKKPQVKMIPDSILLGLNITNDNRKIVIEHAKKAGIKKVYQAIINDNSELDKELILDEQ